MSWLTDLARSTRGTLTSCVWACGPALALLTTPVPAQESAVLDVTVASSIGQSLQFSTVEIVGGLSRFTNENGRITLTLPRPGSVRIRIRHLGYGAVDTTVTMVAGKRQTLAAILEPVVFRISTVNVKARSSCRILSDPDSQLGRLVGELRKNAERELVLRNSYPFAYRLARKMEVGDSRSTGFRHDTVEYGSAWTVNYEPGRLVRPVKLGRGSSMRELRIPTLIDMAEEVFLRSHCFSYAGMTRIAGRDVYQIDFRPVPGLTAPDVAGSAYLDTATFLVLRAVFTLTNPMNLNPPVVGVEVTTSYREILPGLPLVDHILSVQQIAGSRYGRTEEQRLVSVEFADGPPGEMKPLR